MKHRIIAVVAVLLLAGAVPLAHLQVFPAEAA
jgi:hypothetical protein